MIFSNDAESRSPGTVRLVGTGVSFCPGEGSSVWEHREMRRQREHWGSGVSPTSLEGSEGSRVTEGSCTEREWVIQVAIGWCQQSIRSVNSRFVDFVGFRGLVIYGSVAIDYCSPGFNSAVCGAQLQSKKGVCVSQTLTDDQAIKL